jgi:stage V sporulation protein B
VKRFFKTVAVVTVFSVSEKFLGFLYRIFLSRTIDAEGMGLYQVALSVFALLLTLTSSGTPITVSRLMTKYKAENNSDRVQKIITAGLSVTLFTALPVCIVFFIFKNHLGFLFADDRCVSIFLVVLPGLVFTSLYGVFRGVFWGSKDFLPYSIIELIEEICMIVVGIVLISLSNGVFQGAMSAGIAVLVSYILSFSLATFVFFFRKNKLKNPISELKPLIFSSAPVTAMRTANSLANSLVSIVLPIQLISSGLTESQAMSVFGIAMGQSIPLLFAPTTLIGSFTLVLVPEMAENFYKKRHTALKGDIEKALKFAVTIACLFIPAFVVCGEEVGLVVFGNAESGRYLAVSAFLMLFMSVSNITTSMLNSIGLENKTLLFFIVGALFMLLSVWVLPKYLGIYSLIVGFCFVFGLTAVLNLILLNKNCVYKPKFLKFSGLAIAFLVPTIILGFLIKNLILPITGNFFTIVICSVVVTVFKLLLYVCLGLVRIDVLRTGIKGILPFKKKQRA